MIVQRTVASKSPAVIASPMLVSFLELKKAGIFDAKRIQSVSAVNFLEQSVSVLKGIAPGACALLESRQVRTLRDLVELPADVLVGLETSVAKTAYAARSKMMQVFAKYGVTIEHRQGLGNTTMAVMIDPATGISYNR